MAEILDRNTDARAPRTLGVDGPAVTWIEAHADLRPEARAIIEIESGREFTYAALADRIARAASLLESHGIGRGDRVAIVSTNTVEPFEAIYACARIGAIAVPLNWRLAERELADIAEDFQPALVLHSADRRPQATAISAARGVPAIEWGDGGVWEALLAEAVPAGWDRASRVTDPWVIIYTSGTTGRPKGVVHSVGSQIADIENSAVVCGLESSSMTLSFLAPFHVAGLNSHVNPALHVGATAGLMRSFDVDTTLEVLSARRLPVTHFGAPSAVLQMLSAAIGDLAAADLPPLLTTVGGSPVPDELLTMWREVGWRMVPVYGASEAGSTIIAGPHDDDVVGGATGRSTLHSRVRVVAADGHETAPDEIGEIWIGGGALMSGYWGKPDETDAVLTDGWYRTGDAARRDGAGRIRIVDRWKEMFISGAENVYPAEVEAVIYESPDVAAVAIVGVPDEKWGEVGHAFIVRAQGSDIDDAGIRSWCDTRLARYKIPARIEFVDELPQGGSGKVLKNELRDRLRSRA